ncbi:DnaT-like ssDNA-binding domain-containing protein [Litoribacillus peritrichatus]|uniref:DnaT DNA-binding domain-containing protein n=1 Tax=Litoribacillus peritrichatus TaxID=718191 RepID=A0ABP7LZ49_9GAMM
MPGDLTIHFSADLARTYGLDQAITLSVMKQFFEYRPSENGWLAISDQELLEKLSFWPIETIHRALNQLSNQGLINIHQAGNTLHPQLMYKLTPNTRTQGLPIVNAPPNQVTTNQSAPRSQTQQSLNQFNRSSAMTETWQPDRFVIQQCLQLGIPEPFILEAIPEFVTYWRERGISSTSWGAKFQKHALKLWRNHETKVAANKIPQPITKDWKPSEDTVEILTRDNVDPDFIQHSIAEFLLYWMERGSAEITWNTKFVSHIRRQWKQFCSSIEHSTDPVRIPKNWEPSPECYEIARLAQIDIQFAKDQIKPFVLYWSDTNQTSTSWNTKFVQHLKWSWAKRHQLDNIGHHEKNRANHSSGHSANQSFLERHQDTSWADEL